MLTVVSVRACTLERRGVPSPGERYDTKLRRAIRDVNRQNMILYAKFSRMIEEQTS